MPPAVSSSREPVSPKPGEGSRTLAYVAWIVVCIVWGTTYLAIRVALESVPVALVGGLRFTAAGLIMIAALRLTGQPLPSPRAWRTIVLSGFLLLVIGNGAVVWAEQYVASGLAAVIVAMVPFWNVVVEAGRPAGERPTVRTMFGLAVGFAGIVVLVWPELFTETSGNWFVAGVIALQLACAGWAVGTSFTKLNVVSPSPAATSAMQMLAAGLIFLAIATLRDEWTQLTFTVRSASAILYLVIFGSIVAFSAYVYALKQLPIATVSLYSYVNPLIAVVLGTLLLDDRFRAGRSLRLRWSLPASLSFDRFPNNPPQRMRPLDRSAADAPSETVLPRERQNASGHALVSSCGWHTLGYSLIQRLLTP